MTQKLGGDLGPWFELPQGERHEQLTLFPETFMGVLHRLQISSESVVQWYSRGWLSFSLDKEGGLQPSEINELEFLRDVTAFGLPDKFLNLLLSELPKPFSFNPKRIAYSFSLGWVLGVVPPPVENVVEENIGYWVGNLARNGELKKLAEVARLAISSLADSVAEDRK